MERLGVHAVLPLTLANGPGPRSALWLQGCSLACRGCFNPETHDRTEGQAMTVGEAFALLTRVPRLEGVTISGGEPLQQASALRALLARIRRETGLSILLFTGLPWTRAAASHPDLIALADVVIAGPYRAEERRASALIGSANKTVHFITDRYREADLAQVPGAEIVIDESGLLALSGIDPVRPS
jgi:anaerobic ribonucleoside-triphosphate reductase activating protein